MAGNNKELIGKARSAGRPRNSLTVANLMTVRNRAELAITSERQLVLDLIGAGITRVLPEVLMRPTLKVEDQALEVCGRTFDISRGRIFVIGGGKAASAMAQGLEAILGAGRITAGIVACNDRSSATKKVEVVLAGHPIPDRRGVSAARRMMEMKGCYGIGAGDLVLCLVSGGGSALVSLPADGVTLADKQGATRLLLNCGADIREINTVRKHLSAVKGGRLGAFFAPATVLSLIISDVVGDDLASVASGPTCPDPSTFADALGLLERYGLADRAPAGVVEHLRAGYRGEIDETPKELKNCTNVLIGNNAMALGAMAAAGRSLGLDPVVVTAALSGETGEVARLRAQEIMSGRYRGHDLVLMGGETTPRLPGRAGRGGRNQHYALVSLDELKGFPGEWVMASIGTDGSDYLPGVAGALVDRWSLERAAELGIDLAPFIESYNSNEALGRLGRSLIVTGNTGTNVGDLIVYLIGRKNRPKRLPLPSA